MASGQLLAEIYPQPTALDVAGQGILSFMDTLEISGKKYISAKRASEITGYARDYVGQLARGGKVSGTRVGKVWYVSEQEILNQKNGTALIETAKMKIMTAPRRSPEVSEAVQRKHMQTLVTLSLLQMNAGSVTKTWNSVNYFHEEGAHTPRLAPKILREETADLPNENIAISAIPNVVNTVPKSVVAAVPLRAYHRAITGDVDGMIVHKRTEVIHDVSPHSGSRTHHSSASKAQKKTHHRRTGTARMLFVVPSMAAFAAVLFYVGVSVGAEWQTGSVGTNLALAGDAKEGVRSLLELLVMVWDLGVSTVSWFYESILQSFGLYLSNGFQFVMDTPALLMELFSQLWEV